MNSLDIDKAPADTRVVVAMSGGVDSSVVAALLSDQGYDVIGMTMQLYDHGEAVAKSKTCCAGQDIYDARRVADSLGIPHYVVDYEDPFTSGVMTKFADAYVRGETPVPCVLCNQTVKFNDLLNAAKDLGADALATGHYVQRIEGEQGPSLHKGRDLGKDQSYFMFATTPEQLKYVRFPLGGMTKDQTRELATSFGLSVADKPDSQDICFVPDGDYAKVVTRLRPEAKRPGDIVTDTGEVIGKHDGIIHFTIGQRRGLGIGGSDVPLYVVKIDAEANTVVAGPKEALAKQTIHLRDVNWLGGGPASPEGETVHVRIRNTHTPVPALVFVSGSSAEVVLEQPEFGVSPGQACVFYQGNQVLGGGWITADSGAVSFVPHNRRAEKASAISVS